MRTRPEESRAWAEAVQDALRSIAGGLLFGVPLLYTMEVWWLGQTSSSAHALVGLLITVAPIALLIGIVGFRRRPDVTVADVVVDVVTAVGLGVFVVALVLVVLQRITLQTPPVTAAQMIVFEVAPFAFGAAIAGEVFARSRDRETGAGEDDEAAGTNGATLSDLAATAMGAAFVAMSIAPTEEVPMLVTGLERPWLVVLIAAALVVTYLIVFAAGFGDQDARHQQEGVLQHPRTETAFAYLVSLVVSAGLLWFFGNLSVDDPATALAEAVVLSFPAAIGGAAGRLVV